VRLRLTGVEQTGKDIINEIEAYTQAIQTILGDAVVATEDMSMAEIVFNQLSAKNQTLSIAESCTGGYISHQMTMLPGASKVFVGSVVSYSNSVKHHQLGVESTLFETVGAVSEQVVTQMVEGVRERLTTDYAIAVSGVAGPGGGSVEKPVGTVVIGVCNKDTTLVKTFHFIGDRMNVIGRANNMAFEMLRQLIQ
jgi:nicotinamide-nucleotide amidase